MFRAPNQTLIALIPKNQKAYKVEQLRPIALCNLIYEIIANKNETSSGTFNIPNTVSLCPRAINEW